MAELCSHAEGIRLPELPDPLLGCEECLKAGTHWFHLRMCVVCGKVGCCDQSPMQHANGHFLETGHPLIRSAQPGEDWVWCYVDEVTLEL